jgi:hypothetical protein
VSIDGGVEIGWEHVGLSEFVACQGAGDGFDEGHATIPQ